ncbi:MAG: DNA-binding protein [Gammaproteobacteria bacterium]|nr:MAG: DNA-binding protein [Gammaproteobacteria bacterium]
MSGKPKNQILTPNQAAEILMVSPATVRLWAAKGHLKALTTPGGHRRFRMSDIKLFAQAQSITLNLEEDDLVSILIVDDDTQFSGYLAELLPSFDARISVQIANDGFEAGKLVHIFKPDMILMDLMMPSMDGFETCKSIKDDPETTHIRVICMTGFGSQDNINRILRLGAEACLTKPIDEDELESYIQLLLE